MARTRCPSRILLVQPRGGLSRRPARPARALCSVPGTDPFDCQALAGPLRAGRSRLRCRSSGPWASGLVRASSGRLSLW